MHPDSTVLKVLYWPGGSDHDYDFLLAESRKPDGDWESTEEQLQRVCEANDNESENVSAMAQVGLVVQFYRFENRRLLKMGGRLDLVNQVEAVTQCASYMRSNPMPVL